MSTINSSTTGHSRPQERRFANKLFIMLIALVIGAFIFAFIIGQKKELNPTTSEKNPSTSTKTSNNTSTEIVIPQ